MSNYIEIFIFNNQKRKSNEKNAIMLCISLCAPIATYGEVKFFGGNETFGYNFLEINQIYNIFDKDLVEIEKKVKIILENYRISLLDLELLDRYYLQDDWFPDNLNSGDKLLNGIFQHSD